VEHEEADVPAALTQVGKELEEVRLGTGDARDLLGVEYDALRHEWSLRGVRCCLGARKPSSARTQ
jgi:hypothetical protein